MLRTRTAADWSPELIGRFWDYHAAREDRYEEYFGWQVGAAVVRLLELEHVIEGHVLDYGCGPGFVLEHLARRDMRAVGVDSSPRTVAAARRRCGGLPGFEDALECATLPTPFPDGAFDLVLCTETLEHIHREQGLRLLEEMRRLTRPGGRVFITTPHAEDLDRAVRYCPFCDCEYHMWQHLRSITKDGLSEELRAAGFDIVFCEALDLAAFLPDRRLSRARRISLPLDLMWRGILGAGRVVAPRAADRLERRLRTTSGSNLVALARHRVSTPG